MTPSDFIAALHYLDLSLAEFARLTDEDVVIVARWVVGETTIPRWVDALTYCWMESPEHLEIARCDLPAAPCDQPVDASANVLLASWRITRDRSLSVHFAV